MTLKLTVSPVEGTLLITPEMHLPLPISHPRSSELKQDYSCNPRSILATPPPSQCRGELWGRERWGGPCVDLQAEVNSSGEGAKLHSWLCVLVLSVCSCCLKKFLQGGGNDVAQVGASNGLNCDAGFTPMQRESGQTHPPRTVRVQGAVGHTKLRHFCLSVSTCTADVT